jgi:hypothetical protein
VAMVLSEIRAAEIGASKMMPIKRPWPPATEKIYFLNSLTWASQREELASLFAGPSHKSQPNQSTDQIRDQNTARVRRPQRLVGLKHDARGNDLTRSMHHYYYLLFSLHGATLTARRDACMHVWRQTLLQAETAHGCMYGVVV